MKRYHYSVILSNFSFVDSDIKEAKFFHEEEEEGLRIIDNLQGGWGDIYPMVTFKLEPEPLPNKLKLRWITITDLKCYELDEEIDTARMEELWMKQETLYPESPFKYVVVGIAPYGEIAIWLRGNDNAVLLQQLTAKEVEFNEKEFSLYSTMKGDNEKMTSLLSKEQYYSIMRQYKYKYLTLEEFYDEGRWVKYVSGEDYYENIDIEFLEDKRVDGTFDFTDSDILHKYHSAGMPMRIAVKWIENGANCYAHFWLDPYYVTLFFESFSKMFSEKPIDILIRIDTRANRYEVAMTAEGLAPRVFIGTQYIVFRDNAEIGRSEHFYKKDGEWRWS